MQSLAAVEAQPPPCHRLLLQQLMTPKMTENKKEDRGRVQVVIGLLCVDPNADSGSAGFEIEAKNKVKIKDSTTKSPTSVLEDELFYGTTSCALKEEVKLEKEVTADVKDDGTSLISKTMVEEDNLIEARMKEEEVQYEEALDLNSTQFNKLDELLT
ncbi:hypothetical protein GYH30_033787 [Glycine max]|nr:hypothetical protein GYH30_033787 [Glycine max]